MNIIAVDDERFALRMLERALVSAAKDAKLTCFQFADEAISYARENVVDVAFLDIEMSDMHGLLLAKQLKDINPITNIIFVTGYSQYALEAFGMSASGYVLKPIDAESVAKELDCLRYPVKIADEKIRIQCFGNFEVFVDGKPMDFARSKSKEALAYLVDRKGAGVSKKELAAVLLDDAPYTRSIQSYIHTIIAEMMRALNDAGAENFIISKRGVYAVDASKISCDYYDYEKGDLAAVNSYHGEYMTNYSWAEFTVGLFLKDLKK